MPFIPTANVVRVSCEYDISGLPGANVLHMQHSAGALTQAEVDDAALQVAVAWAANVMPSLTSNVELLQVVVTDVSSLTGPQGSAVSGINGSSVSSPLPPNVATCVTIRTGLRSRSGRGRVYLPGVGEDKVDGAGVITPAYRSGIEAGFADLDADLAALGGTIGPLLMGVLSLYTTDPGPPPVPNTPRAAGLFNRATVYAVDGTIDSQRRRLR